MNIAIPERIPAAAELGRVHFVGMGGAGMSGIARILLDRGFVVSGSDAKDSDTLLGLRALGASTYIGHAPENVDSADTVVVSTAIRADNPEVRRAAALDLRMLPRAAALAAVMIGFRGIAVAGTHGKTTTTSMLTVALQHAGADPSFAIGGNLSESGTNAHDGTGEVFVAEADESDGSFLAFQPEIAVVTNVEPDHLDTFGTHERYMEAFDAFAARVQRVLVACADDPGARALAERHSRAGGSVRMFGQQAATGVQVGAMEHHDHGTRAQFTVDGGPSHIIDLQLPGVHNALNAAAALAAGTALGIDAEALVRGLAAFTGTRRRFEARGTAAGVRVYDDYAHHPTEVAALLAAARALVGDGRLVVVFQPHLFSRTRIFASEFGAALSAADVVVVMDVFAAREEPEPGVTGQLIAQAIDLPAEQVYFEPSWSAVPALAAGLTRPGDVVLTVGAGDVTLIAPELLRELVAQR
ncbi:MAG TPA: UDP-N-acetylmuramate--L-alanine ligase [Jiangellaceae bacterium]|nr:UDP-N-acetylmuramate--L-alanine ligase [Jiangellaceae bacterium]